MYIDIFGLEPEHGSVRVRLLPVSRGVAAILLLMRSPSRLLKAVRGPPGGLARELALLITLLQNRPKQLDYPIWVDLFDRWSDNDRDTLLFCTPPPNMAHDRIAGRPGESCGKRMQCDECSLQEQWLPAPVTAVCLQDSMPPLGDILMERAEEYIAILQAGEVLPPLRDRGVRRPGIQAGIPGRALCG